MSSFLTSCFLNFINVSHKLYLSIRVLYFIWIKQILNSNFAVSSYYKSTILFRLRNTGFLYVQPIPIQSLATQHCDWLNVWKAGKHNKKYIKRIELQIAASRESCSNKALFDFFYSFKPLFSHLIHIPSFYMIHLEFSS